MSPPPGPKTRIANILRQSVEAEKAHQPGNEQLLREALETFHDRARLDRELLKAIRDLNAEIRDLREAIDTTHEARRTA